MELAADVVEAAHGGGVAGALPGSDAGGEVAPGSGAVFGVVAGACAGAFRTVSGAGCSGPLTPQPPSAITPASAAASIAANVARAGGWRFIALDASTRQTGNALRSRRHRQVQPAATPLCGEERGPVVELAAQCCITGEHRADHRPEARRVVELDDVGHLVRDDVLGELRRELHEPPVEADLTARVAAPPLAARVRKPQSGRHAVDARRIGGDARRDECPRLLTEPAPHAVGHLLLVVRARVSHDEMEKVGGDGERARVVQLEGELVAAIDNRRARFPAPRHYLAPAPAPFGECADDPFGTLGEGALDFTDAYPARRAHRQPVEIDLHADRAPPRADEPVLDR